MRRELTSPKLTRFDEANLRSFLREAPWGWPRRDDPEALQRAINVSASEGPRPLAPGEALLLTARTPTEGGAVWVLHLEGGLEAGVPVDAAPTWTAALQALPGALPLLWRSTLCRERRATFDPLRVLPEAPPSTRRVVGREGSDLEVKVQGESLGLSFLLAQASLVLDEPLPLDVAASATVNLHGDLGHVDGLRAKVRAVVDAVPRVTRLLVALEDEREARAAVADVGADASIEVVGLSTAREALTCAFPDLEAHWAARGADAPRRRRALFSLLMLALGDRSEAGDWQPVRRAAQLARRDWPALTDTERFELTLAEAIAARHVFDAVPLILPSRDAVAALPEPTRTTVVRQLVQQATDTGVPDPEGTEALALSFVPERPADGFPEHLGLIGALGRLAANTGRLQLALERQLRAAEAWLERPSHRGISYPLSELYRLATVLERPDVFERAEALSELAIANGTLLAADPWVRGPRAGALLGMGRLQEAATDAETLWRREPWLPYVSIATRVRRAAATRLGDLRAAADVDQALEARLQSAASGLEAAERDGGALAIWRARERFRDLRTCRLLIALEATSQARDAAGAIDAARALQDLHPELCTLLLRGTPTTEHAAALLRLFPY